MESFDNGQKLVNQQIAKTQGEIFQYAQNCGYDMVDFITKYMNTKFCNQEMDSEYSYYHGKPDTVLISYVRNEISIKMNSSCNISDPYWVGAVYRYISIFTKIPSKQLVTMISPKEMDNLSVSYENMEVYEAARDIIKNRLGV